MGNQTPGNREHTAKSVSATLGALEVRPSKGRGQNFLISESIVERTVDALRPTPLDHVVEVGSGLGILTRELMRRSGHVVAIEIDERLADHLRELLPGDNLSILTADALSVEPSQFLPSGESYLFAGNLPFSVGSAIVRRFLELPHPPERMVVMVQREVAERMAATPPHMSVLGVSVQLYCTAEIAFHVPPSAFKPRPKVESSVVMLERRSIPLLFEPEREAFFEVVHAGFRQKRKQLANTLSSGLGISKTVASEWLKGSGVSPTQRAESLDLEVWLSLFRNRPV